MARTKRRLSQSQNISHHSSTFNINTGNTQREEIEDLTQNGTQTAHEFTQTDVDSHQQHPEKRLKSDPVSKSNLNRHSSPSSPSKGDQEQRFDDDDEFDKENELSSAGFVDENLEEKMRDEEEKGFACVGILDKIKVIDFMCHAHFEFEFGPNVNIIQGENGSGKSAIVAALQIGLGAVASSTERGKKLTDHIRNGQREAIISIFIRNRAQREKNTASQCVKLSNELRYRPDEFGDTIEIQRVLRRDSSGRGGGWSFKSWNGKRVNPANGRSAKRELCAILDHFNIQIGNPVSVLTQQKSKQFLARGKPAELYRFFMEATLLEDIRKSVSVMMDATKDMKYTLELKHEQLPEIKAVVEKLQKRFERAQGLKPLEEKIQRMEKMWAWKLVDEREDGVNKLKEKRRKLLKSMKGLEEELDESTERKKKAEEEFGDVKKGMDEKSEVLRVFLGELEKIKSEMRRLSEKKRVIEAGEKSARREYECALQMKRKLEKSMEAQKMKHVKSHDDRKKLEMQCSALERTLNEIDSGLSELERMIASIESEMQGYREQSRKFADDEERFRRKLKHLRGELSHLERMEENELIKWGRDTPGILRAIDQSVASNRFHHQPIGPIGRLVSVLDSKWARAVQSAVSRRWLSAYIVHDTHDEYELRRLTKNSVTIVVSSLTTDRYSIPDNAKPSKRYTSVLDMMSFNSNAVFNVLVDQCEIERQLLFENKNEMENVAWSGQSNVKTCWHLDGSQAYSRNGSDTFRSGDQSMHVLLGQNMSAAKGELQREIQKCESEWDRMRQDSREFEKERHAMAQREGEMAQRKRSLKREESGVKREIENVRNEMERIDEGMDYAEFEAQIASVEGDIVEKRELLESMDLERTQVERELVGLDEKRRAKQEEGRELQRDQVRLETAMETKSRAVMELTRFEKQCVIKFREKQPELKRLNESIEEHKQELAEIEIEAKHISQERVIDAKNRTSEELDSVIQGLKQQLKADSARFDGKCVKDLEFEFKEMHGKQCKIEQEIHAHSELYDDLVRGIKLRRNAFVKIRKHQKNTACSFFSYYLGKRGHFGSLDFNYGEQELSMSVQIASHEVKSGEVFETKELRSLSGGEKSFVTLSFMLAVGESMEIPFRVMDEFDVFMDEANRRAAYDTVVETAKACVSRQFIFITPHKLPNIKASELIKIQRLQPPTRK